MAGGIRPGGSDHGGGKMHNRGVRSCGGGGRQIEGVAGIGQAGGRIKSGGADATGSSKDSHASRRSSALKG